MATLQDICLQITDGKHGDCENEKGSGYYFISCKDVKDGWVDYSGARQITEEDYLDTHRRTGLEPDDILITNSGTIGRMALVPRAPETGRTTFQKSVAILKPRQENVIPRWLYYCLMARKVELIAWAGGTAQKNLLLRDLRAFEVATPSHPTQRKIASILSAYDDLIENNLRRIKILEEMAQLIYREWFVNFRFPGYEDVGMNDSDLGPIPKGWEVKRVDEFATLYRGKSYRSADLVGEGGLPFLNLKCVDRGGGFRYDGIRRYDGSFKDSQTARVSDIIVAVTDITQERGVVAHAARVPSLGDDIAVLSMDLVKVEPLPSIAGEYLYGMLRFSTFADEVKQHANGVNVLHLNPECIEEYEFPLPPPDLRRSYAQFCADVYKQCDTLHMKNVNLRHTRDLLLPKLIWGELDVEDLDIDTEGVGR